VVDIEKSSFNPLVLMHQGQQKTSWKMQGAICILRICHDLH